MHLPAFSDTCKEGNTSEGYIPADTASTGRRFGRKGLMGTKAFQSINLNRSLLFTISKYSHRTQRTNNVKVHVHSCGLQPKRSMKRHVVCTPVVRIASNATSAFGCTVSSTRTEAQAEEEKGAAWLSRPWC